MTAENPGPAAASRRRRRCFNEAAADDRGKLGVLMNNARMEVAASMRPRPMTAENGLVATRCDSTSSPPQREGSRDPDHQ